MLKKQRKNLERYIVFVGISVMAFQSCTTTSPPPSPTPQTELKSSANPKVETKHIQIVNFNLEGITHNDFMGVAKDVAPNFAPLSGLISKVWLSDETNNTYGGVYSWKSQKDCENYRNGELYAGALTNNKNFANLSDKGFSVLEGPSSVTGNLLNQTPTYIQVINFNLEGITHGDFMGVAKDVAPNFAALPGLISKVWLSDEANNTYGGVYSWKSQKDCENYRNGELYAGALTNNKNFANLSDKGFSVLEEPSKVTHMK